MATMPDLVEAADAVLTVYAVHFSNYYPLEIESLWMNEEQAKARAEQLNQKQHCREWSVDTKDILEIPPQQPGDYGYEGR